MRTTSLLIAATVGLALGAPAAADAAESFVGISAGTKVVRFSTNTLPATTTPKALTGLAAGESVVALDTTPSGELLGLGSKGTLYVLKAGSAQAVTLAPTALGDIPADEAATFSVSADGTSVRVIAAGRDRDVALPSGAITRDDPGVAFAAGDVNAGPAAPAVDRAADGSLLGVEAVHSVRAGVDALGAHTLGELEDVPLHRATRTTIASDGRQWILTGLAGRDRQPLQSRILFYDPARGELRQQASFLRSELGAIAAVGQVADDTKAPTATVRIPKQTYRDAVRRKGIVVVVKTSEAGQTVASLRKGKANRGFGFGTADRAGELRFLVSSSPAHLKSLRGGRVLLHLAVHDNAGNTKLIDRAFTLPR